VSQLPVRLQEAGRQGFSAAAVPRHGLDGLTSTLELHPERSVERLRAKPWLGGAAEE